MALFYISGTKRKKLKPSGAKQNHNNVKPMKVVSKTPHVHRNDEVNHHYCIILGTFVMGVMMFGWNPNFKCLVSELFFGSGINLKSFYLLKCSLFVYFDEFFSSSPF